MAVKFDPAAKDENWTMNSYFEPMVRTDRMQSSRWFFRAVMVWTWVWAITLFGLDLARASFHVWAVTELYSSADGSVQFIKLTNSTTFSTEYFMAGHMITCVGPSGTSNTFTFPANLPAVSTANKCFLIGTSNLTTLPGGVTPDYFFTNSSPFLFLTPGGANTVGIVGSVEPRAVYTNLPTDGVFSLLGLASSFTPTTNAPENFSGQVNSIVPVKFNPPSVAGTNFVMTFRTATGVNGAAGPTYTVEYKNLLTDANWSALTTVPGDGAVHSVSNSATASSPRFFRLNVP